MSGVRAYKRPRKPPRWWCRLRGGHFEGQAFYLCGTLDVWSRVCPRCGAYLGRVEPSNMTPTKKPKPPEEGFETKSRIFKGPKKPKP